MEAWSAPCWFGALPRSRGAGAGAPQVGQVPRGNKPPSPPQARAFLASRCPVLAGGRSREGPRLERCQVTSQAEGFGQSSRPRSPVRSLEAPSDGSPGSSKLERAARELLASHCGGPILLPPARGCEAAPDVAFQGDLCSAAGVEAYGATAAAWRARRERGLPELRSHLSRVAQVAPDTVIATWSTTWIPPQLQWLVSLARQQGWEITFYDILDQMDQVVSFSWSRLIRLFWRAFTQGKIRIPHACIRGTTTLVFASLPAEDAAGPAGLPALPVLARHEERLELVGHLRRRAVQNRRIARDVLDYLDAHRPLDLPLGDWDDLVEEDLAIVGSVPGMGQFDIDGLESTSARSDVYENVAALLFVSTVLVLAAGIVLGVGYFQHLEQEKFYREILQAPLDYY